MNKLAGLNITNLRIVSSTLLTGFAQIPNPSVMTLDLGNVTMDLSVDGTAIGQALLPDLILKPGDNNVTMQSSVAQLVVISLVTSKYTNGVLPVSIVGNSSVRNGEHLTYYEEAIKSNTINLDLNIAPALAAIGYNVTG